MFLGGGSSSGQFNSANLPNIIGAFPLQYDQISGAETDWLTSRCTGAFYDQLTNIRRYYISSGNAGTNTYMIGYDSSRYNSTYNNSNRVNPNYYTVEFWIKYK